MFNNKTSTSLENLKSNFATEIALIKNNLHDGIKKIRSELTTQIDSLALVVSQLKENLDELSTTVRTINSDNTAINRGTYITPNPFVSKNILGFPHLNIFSSPKKE